MANLMRPRVCAEGPRLGAGSANSQGNGAGSLARGVAASRKAGQRALALAAGLRTHAKSGHVVAGPGTGGRLHQPKESTTGTCHGGEPRPLLAVGARAGRSDTCHTRQAVWIDGESLRMP